MSLCNGAGVIPFCVRDDDVLFLFHTTFEGKKVGFLMDCGGRCFDDESSELNAAREFAEETCGYLGFFTPSSNLKEEPHSSISGASNEMLHKLRGPKVLKVSFQSSLSSTYTVFFTRVEYVPQQLLSLHVSANKKREFLWISSSSLLYPPLPYHPRIAKFTEKLPHMLDHIMMHEKDDCVCVRET